MDDFVENLRVWVSNVMPEWRRTPYKWPLNRDIPADGDWSRSTKGGANGIVMVLIALSWGLQQAKSARKHREILSLVEDMVFALREMTQVVDLAQR